MKEKVNENEYQTGWLAIRHSDPRMNISSDFFAKGSLFQTQIISKRFIKTKK